MQCSLMAFISCDTEVYYVNFPVLLRLSYDAFQSGYTPLHSACHFGHINMIRFLLENGASVNATTKVDTSSHIYLLSDDLVLEMFVVRLQSETTSSAERL